MDEVSATGLLGKKLCVITFKCFIGIHKGSRCNKNNYHLRADVSPRIIIIKIKNEKAASRGIASQESESIETLDM